MHVYASTGHITLFQSTLYDQNFYFEGKIGKCRSRYSVSVMDPCDTKTLLSVGYVLILTEKFAVDLGTILRWVKPTPRCL